MEADREGDSSASGGRRRAKTRRNRRALEANALRLFEERGYDDVTVSEIAEAALLSTRTFFRYFASKEEVVFHREPSYADQLVAILAARPEVEAPDIAVARALLEYADALHEERNRVLPRMRLLSVTPELLAKGLLLRRELELSAAKELARRCGTPVDVRLRAMAAARVAAFTAASAEWFLCEGERPYRELVEEAFTALGYDF